MPGSPSHRDCRTIREHCEKYRRVPDQFVNWRWNRSGHLVLCSSCERQAAESGFLAHFIALPFTFAAKMSHASSPSYLSSAVGQATLVSESRRDFEKQFDRILREHGPAISRLAYSYEAVASIREELVQDIALAIWQALPHFRGECSERTFIFRIAHNRGLSHSWKRRPVHQPLDELEESDQPADPRPHPEEQAAQTDQRARLMSAIQSLAVPHRQMIALMLEDFGHADMAEVLGITENNVAVRLNRARKALRDALGVRP